MDKKSKIFFLAFFLLIAGSVAASYYRYVVARDYIVQAETDCDPYAEACFVYVCDPEAGEECTGDPEEDTWYYKLVERNAKNIALCDPSDESCDALTCPEGEADCEEMLCSDEALAEKELDGECTDPLVYLLENPIEEEEEVSEEEGVIEDESAVEEDATEEEGVAEAENAAATESSAE